MRYEIPASETPEGQARLAVYYASLGKFIDIFSRAEATVEYVLRHYAGMGPRVAVVILAGVRVDVATRHIKRLSETAALTPERQEELLGCLQQLDVINGARNSILHFGATNVAEGEGIVTNELKRGKERSTWFPVSPETLEQMTDDLRRIITLLSLAHAGRPPLKNSTVEQMLRGALKPAWQYKHDERPTLPAQKPAGRNPKAQPQSHPRPPSSSRE